jgi:hypothetical protein
MARDAITIFGWYLRRMPLLAVAAFFVAGVNLWAYEAFGQGANLFCGSLTFGLGAFVIARGYEHLGRRPRTAREQDQEREQVADWHCRLSAHDRELVAQMARNTQVAASTGITAREAARHMARFR